MFHFYMFEILLIFFVIYEHIISKHSLLLLGHVYSPYKFKLRKMKLKLSHNFSPRTWDLEMTNMKFYFETRDLIPTFGDFMANSNIKIG